jgi:hypothetical protein
MTIFFKQWIISFSSLSNCFLNTNWNTSNPNRGSTIMCWLYSLRFCIPYLEMPVPSQGHYGFHSFPVVDWFCLFIYLWVLTFSLLDCSEFGNFVITLILSFSFQFNMAHSSQIETTMYKVGWNLKIYGKSLHIHQFWQM